MSLIGNDRISAPGGNLCRRKFEELIGNRQFWCGRQVSKLNDDRDMEPEEREKGRQGREKDRRGREKRETYRGGEREEREKKETYRGGRERRTIGGGRDIHVQRGRERGKRDIQ